MIETAKKHIEGEVSIDDVDALISTYYQSEAAREYGRSIHFLKVTLGQQP